MKKLFLILVLLLAAGMVFAGGGRDGAGRPIELVYTMVAVPGDAHAQGMMVFRETVERVSNGEIRVLTFDSGSLFRQEQELAAVMSGQAHMSGLSAPWLTDLSPWVSMFSAGYIFQSYEHMTRVLNGPIGEEVFDRIAREQGVRPLGAKYLGTRQLNMVDDRHINTPEDLRGVNLRMPNSPAWIFLGQAMGANPTAISFSELYMALQTRTVDGQDNPLPTNRSARFYEVTRSITITNHVVDSIWPTINEAFWQSLNDQQRGWIMEGVRAAIEFTDAENLRAEAELVQFFRDRGLSVHYADVGAFSRHVLDQYLRSEFASTWDMALFYQVQNLAD